MHITLNEDGSKTIIVPTGKLTVQSAPELGKVIEQLSANVRDIVVDLAGVDYIASAGLRVLVAADKLAATRGGSLHVKHPTEAVMESLRTTGLADVFSIEH